MARLECSSTYCQLIHSAPGAQTVYTSSCMCKSVGCVAGTTLTVPGDTFLPYLPRNGFLGYLNVPLLCHFPSQGFSGHGGFFASPLGVTVAGDYTAVTATLRS